MIPLVNALLCGLCGAVAAHGAYVRSNLFLIGDTVRRGRHLLWDPLAFAGLGLLFGLVVGGVVGAFLFPSSLGKSMLAGVLVTLLGVAAVGGVVTYVQYGSLPHEPRLEGGPMELEFELWLPAGRDAATGLPGSGILHTGAPQPVPVQLSPQQLRTSEGRLVLPGRAPVAYALAERLLSIADYDGAWVNFTLPQAAVPTAADAAWSTWLAAINAGEGVPAPQVCRVRSRVLAPGRR